MVNYQLLLARALKALGLISTSAVCDLGCQDEMVTSCRAVDAVLLDVDGEPADVPRHRVRGL